jgi:hypothetical protein
MKLCICALAFSIVWISISGTAAQGTPAWMAQGNQARAGLGSTVSAAGDVNRDGYDDVIVAAYAYDNGQTDEGRVYVFHGSKYGLAKLPAWSVETDQAFARIEAGAAAGDVNGDGYDDVLIGSKDFSNGQYLEGKAFLYLGSASGLAHDAAWSAEGNEQVAYFASSVSAAGDVNGDGFGDVIIGALFLDLMHTPQGEGAAFLYLGSPAGLSASPDWSARGNQQFSYFGNGRSAGDVNGDGYDDVVVGAGEMSHGERHEGRVFVYLGSPSGLSTSPDWTAEGYLNGAEFGSSVGSAGDVNGDGFDDLIVGASGYRSGGFGRSAEGRVSVYLGSATGLSASPAWTVTGDQGGAVFGIVAGAGDLDGDGFDDVLIGAPGYDHFQQNEGRVYAYFGSPLGLKTRTLWVVESNQKGANLGDVLAGAGDVNGDGIDDVIIGANLFDAGQTDEGGAFVFHGVSTHRFR